jgi:membrane fusion protein (multidrug efflux system)
MSPLKQVGLLVLVGAAAAGWYFYPKDTAQEERGGGGRPERTVTVETAQATYRDMETVVEAVGSTRAHRSVEITPLSAGRVVELNIQSGESVTEGEVLLRLDSEIQQADLSEAEARLTEARNKLERARKLLQSNTISNASLDQVVAELAIAEAERERAQRRLADRFVLAPFGGVLGLTDLEVGSRVEEGDVVSILDDLSLVEIEFSLNEALFGKVRPGSRVVADAAAFPGRFFEGEVQTVDSRVDPLSRSFRTRAVVANEDRALPAGMFMHISVILESAPALAIPEEAVVVDGSQSWVFVITEKDGEARADRRAVEIGRRAFGVLEVSSGLSEGEEVVIRGVQKVRDGSKVERKPPAIASPEAEQSVGS